MNNYAIFFDKDGIVYQLPVNPEEMKVSTVQANEKYEILKLGQIVVPTHLELTEYSFECEFPSIKIGVLAGAIIGSSTAAGFSLRSYLGVPHYAETSSGFMGADSYLALFDEWRKKNEPVRFIASNGIGEDINSLVLIESLEITEKAGEEGDKYVSFRLLEYREYGKRTMVNVGGSVVLGAAMAVGTKKKIVNEVTNPKSNGYHIVKFGESLWAIAKKYYGDGAKCNIIYNANKDKIKNPSVIKVGWKLKIPDKSQFSKYSAALPKTITKEPTLPKFTGGSRAIQERA
jgi:hypothetical protein